MKEISKLLCLMLALVLMLPSAAIVMSAQDSTAASAINDEASPKYVLYEEDFDDVTGTITLDPGNNMSGDAKGWIYTKKSETGSVKIENGRMYIEGNLYDVVYRDGGETWGNYTLEADFCYTDENKNWGGMLFNVQSGYKFQKVGISTAGDATINGYDNGWTNDNKSINHWSMTNDSSLVIPQNGDPFRMKVTVYNKTATFYYAMLNEDGSMKTDFIQLMSISNIPANAQTGSIGFMLPRKNTEWGSYWVDNIKCYSDTLVSYSENFDSYGDTPLTADAKNAALGVYFEKSNTLTNGGAEIKDGALHLSGGGKNFNAVFFECGYNWTNYVVESDFTYVSESNNAGWGGLLFRSQDIDNFWKGGVYPASTAKQPVLNSQVNGSWYKDSDNKAAYSMAYGETVRLRIVVNEKTATLYVAKYEDGVLGEWTKLLTTASEDKFASVHMQGTVGVIVGGNQDTKEKHVYIDNLTVSRIEGADRMATPPNAADIYEPVSGIVNPPVVVQELTDTLPNAKGERAAVVMTKVDADMNVLKSDGTVLTTVSSFIDTYRDVLIPAFIVDSEAEATALAALIHEKELIDCYVVADQKNAALVKQVRLANDTTRLISGALIFDDLNSAGARKEARALVADNMSYVAISRAPLTDESAFYFALRQVAAWSYASDVAGVYKGIANGYHGIISTDVSYVYDVYESITDVTVSGKPVIIAHRGANASTDVPYPENTLMGIRAAKQIYGADAAEIDFGLSSDGYAILMHDGTVDRTTNGTGNFSSFTLEQLKALVVDEVAGKETTIPTLEEAIQLALELDIVLYCHVKTVSDANIAVFSYLVDKYDAHENVLLFNSSFEKYNSNIDTVVSSTAYGFTNQAVVTDGITFTAENQAVLEGLDTYLDGVVAMRNSITKYNYQPIFYQYSKQGTMWGEETFYYQLSARGLVNTHSTTDGQATMDKSALTGSGAVGYLTNNIHLSDDYHYAIDLQNEKLNLKLGEAIDLKKAVKMIVGSVEKDCGFIQLSGPTLESVEGGYALNDSGKVTVVYYADRTADGGSTYRVYSEPVVLAFGCVDHVLNEYGYCEKCQVKIIGASTTVGRDLTMKYYVALYDDSLVDTANGQQLAMQFTRNEKTETVYAESELSTNGEYIFAYEHIAPQCMTDLIDAELVVVDADGNTVKTLASNKGYSIKANAQTLLAEYGEKTDDVSKALVQFVVDMLHYGAAAQNYKQYNLENLATAGISGTPGTALPETTDYGCTTPTNDNVYFTGATVWFDNVNKIGVQLNAYTENTKVIVKVGNSIKGIYEDLTSNVIYTDAIYATGFADVYTVELYESGDLIQTLIFSVKSYVYAMKDSATMGELAKALYNYGVSAEAYVNAQNQ